MNLRHSMHALIARSLECDVEEALLGQLDHERRADTFPFARRGAYGAAYGVFGDLVATGTPDGIGPLQEGDVVEVEIPGVGTLSNPVVAEA